MGTQSMGQCHDVIEEASAVGAPIQLSIAFELSEEAFDAAPFSHGFFEGLRSSGHG